MNECSTCGRCFEEPLERCPEDGQALSTPFGGPCLLDRKYLLLRRLGGGGMGAVYRARHLGLERLAAVKILRPLHRHQEHFEHRFRNEARVLGRLRHPHIVEVTDFGIDAERAVAYLVMECLEGISLAELLHSRGLLAGTAALPIAEQIAAALDDAHASAIVHCDLKPSNVLLVGADALRPQVKVIDFGLAHVLADPEATPALDAAETPNEDRGEVAPASAAGTLVGTAAYMAPELVSGQPPSAASDIYAFGVLVYEMLTGHRPFEGPPMGLLAMHLRREPPLPSTRHAAVARELDPAILAPLAKAPEARPATARDTVAGLWEVYRRIERRRWRPRRLATALVLALLLPLLAPALESPLVAVENLLIDARFAFSSPRAPGHPLLLVLLDDATLARDATPLVAQADAAGELLEGMFRAGAAGVGIDVLLPANWGRSAPFSELVLHHADELALAAYSPPDGPVIGPEVLDPLTVAVLGPQRVAELFGFVNVRGERDGIVRRSTAMYRDLTGHTRPSFAVRAARILGEVASPPPEEPFWIDFTVDWRRIPRLSWSELPELLARQPERFRARLILVGGDFAASGDEASRVPHPGSMPEAVSGPVLQALTVHTLLDGLPIRRPGAAAILPWLVLLAAAGAMAVLGAPRRSLRFGGGLAAAAVWLAAVFAGFVGWRILLPAAAPIATIVIALILSGIAGSILSRFERTYAPQPS